MRTVFLALVIAFGCSWSAAAVPPARSYTHNTPPAVSEPSFKIAATWFLPDWQAGLTSRTQEDSSAQNTLTCSDYGLLASIPANAVCQSSNPTSSLTCYSACSCKSGYIQTGSIENGCIADCSGYTLGTPNCQNGQSIEYCPADSSYFRCEGTACPTGVTCGTNQYCIQSAVDIQSGCGSYCTKCGDCPTGVTCNESKCALAHTIVPGSGCANVCAKCCPASIDCDYGCKTYSKEAACTDVCIECKAKSCPTSVNCDAGCKTYSTETGCTDVCIECEEKVCTQPEGDCWTVSSAPASSTSTSTPSATTPSATTPSTTTPSTTTSSTATAVPSGCAPTTTNVYQESNTENYSNGCGVTYQRTCYTPKAGYGWNQVNASDILYFSPDAVTVTPVIPTGGILQTDTTGSTPAKYSLTLQYFKSCEKYFRRDCKLYESSDGFSAVGSVWNTGSQTSTATPSTPTTTTPTTSSTTSTSTSTSTPTTTPSTTSCATTSNTYGYENPYTVISDERDSNCGWKYTRCCYIPAANAGWTEIAYTGSTSIPSTIPDTPSSSCASMITTDYMSWENNQPINCSGTITFKISCDGTTYFKCTVDGSETTSIDVTTMPTIITGSTMKPIKTIGERGTTTVTQTLSSCGKSYQRTCKVPTADGLWYVLNANMSVTTQMFTSCGIKYGKTSTPVCTTPTFPNCSGGTGFQLQASNGCLSYSSCSTTTTPTDPSTTCTLNHDFLVENVGFTSGSSTFCLTGKTLVNAISCDGKAVSKCLSNVYWDSDTPWCQDAINSFIEVSSTSSSNCKQKCYLYNTSVAGSNDNIAYICSNQMVSTNTN